MRTRTITTGLAAGLALTAALGLSACSGSDSGSGSDSSSPAAAASSASTVSLSGDFSGLNDKKVAGTVKISGDTLTLSGFSSDEGPDLHLYLATGTDEAAVTGGVQLGKVAFDQSSQTFSLNGVDASKYTEVVVHCDKAKAVFGAAAIS